MIISHQPYINYQDNVIKNILSSDFKLDTVGPAANQEEKISVLLDAVASFIFAGYPRVKITATGILWPFLQLKRQIKIVL